MVQKLTTFLNGKIYIIFDHNALLSILYLIFWYFYNYFWCFGLNLSVFHDFLGQKLILVCLLRLPTSYQKMSIYENIQNIWFVGLALQHISFEFRKLTWYKNNSWKIEISIFCKIFKKKSYGQKRIFCEVGNFIWLLIRGKQTNYKKLFFQKLWKKPELLMVLTLKFDKNSQRYITFNLQRLSRTVLVYHFNKKKRKRWCKENLSEKISSGGKVIWK